MSLELVQKNMILMSLNGSTLYGTSTETSDIDYMGVYIEDPFNVFLGPPMESVKLNSKPNDRKREANEASRVAIVRPVAIFAGLVNLVMVFGGWIRYNLLWKTEDEKAWIKLSQEGIQPDVT